MSTSEKDPLIGFVSAAVSVLCFGVYAVPTKLYDTRDGVSFQFFECVAIFIVGMAVQVAVVGTATHELVFYPLAMIGGALWCLGNVFVVPVVSAVGLSLGMLVWGTSNMLVGWASGHFGLFGLDQETVVTPWLNYTGVGVAVLALLLYGPIKTTVKKVGTAANPGGGGNASLVAPGSSTVNSLGSPVHRRSGGPNGPNSSSKFDSGDLEKLLTWTPDDDTGSSHADEASMLLSLSSSQQPESAAALASSRAAEGGRTGSAATKVLGLVGALISGVFYGFNTVPVQLLAQTHPNVSSLEFALSHFTGILLTSLVVLVGYSLGKCNRPFVEPRSIVPGLAAGVLWGVAQCGWFIANKNLDLVVSFPIICIGPGMVASVIGIAVFKEIRGARNYAWLAAAFSLTIVAIGCITISKTIKI